MIHGGKPPLWAAVLLAAKEWGCTPWSIAGDGEPVKWFYRWVSFTKWHNVAEKAAAKRAARRSR